MDRLSSRSTFLFWFCLPKITPGSPIFITFTSQVNLMIRSIDKIDDVKMEFSVQITFRLSLIEKFGTLQISPRQKWFDDRLQFAHKVSPAMKDKIKYLTITEPGKVTLNHLKEGNINKSSKNHLWWYT